MINQYMANDRVLNFSMFRNKIKYNFHRILSQHFAFLLRLEEAFKERITLGINTFIIKIGGF